MKPETVVINAACLWELFQKGEIIRQGVTLRLADFHKEYKPSGRTHLESLGLSTRAINCLKSGYRNQRQIGTVEDLASCTQRDILMRPGVGPTTFAEIILALERKNIWLRNY